MLTIMQMVNTRRGTETSQQGAENNPPPPPQTLAEVVAQQTQIMHMLAQNQMNQQQPQHRQASPRWPPIVISREHIRPSLLRLMTHLRQTFGSASWSPNLS